MHKHHQESIQNMMAHYQENPNITALFLVGSVATNTERPDSDLDGVAVVDADTYEQIKQEGRLEEVVHGKCTYEGGYFNIHYLTKALMEELSQTGSEPMRNLFDQAKPLYCHDPELIPLAQKISNYPQEEATQKQFKFYCTFRMLYNYYWCRTTPTGYMRHHIADSMVYNLYRLILIENQILFPSMRKLEEHVLRAPNKPPHLIKKCHRFLESLNDHDCQALIEAYESWTTYDYPKDHNTVMNNFQEPYEWL